MKIEINNTVIPYYPNISLPVVLKSAFFMEDEKIPGSYIFNSNFPASDQLKQVFSFAHKVTRSGRATAELPYTIQQDAIKYTGTCIVQQADEESYEIAFKVNSGEFAGQISGKTLKDLDWGEDITIVDAMTMVIKEGDYYLDDFLFEDDQEFNVYRLIEWNEVIDLGNQFGRTIPNAFIPDNTGDYKFSFGIKGTMGCSWAKLIVRIGNTDHEYTLLEDDEHDASPISLDINETFHINSGDICKIFFYVRSRWGRWAPTGNYANGYFINVENGFFKFSTESIFEQNKLNDQSSTDWCVFPYLNSKFFDSFPDDAFLLDNISIKTIYSEYFNVINYYKDNQFPLLMLGTLEDESVIAANIFNPSVFMNTILKKIIDESGFEMINNPFEDPDFENMVLLHQFVENIYSNGVANVIPVKESFNLKDHVPALQQNEFIRYISVLTGYFPFVNVNAKQVIFQKIQNHHIITDENSQNFSGIILKQKQITVKPEYLGTKFKIEKAGEDGNLERIKDITDDFTYKGEVLSIEYIPSSNNEPGDVYLITSLQEYWAWQYNSETYIMGWTFYSVNWPLDHTTGTEPYLSFSTGICPILTKYYKDNTPGVTANRWWIIPEIETPGIFEGFPDSYNNKSGLQVAYYGGMRTDSNNEEYPVASCNHFNLGVGVTKQDINAKSIYENRYKGFVDWIVNHSKPVKMYAVMTPLQLHNLKIEKIQTTHEFNFLIKEVKVAIQASGVSAVELDVYTV